MKYKICLKTLLQQGISKSVFYGDLVYRFTIIVGKLSYSDQFKKIIKRLKVWNTTQSAYLVKYTITV